MNLDGRRLWKFWSFHFLPVCILVHSVPIDHCIDAIPACCGGARWRLWFANAIWCSWLRALLLTARFVGLGDRCLLLVKTLTGCSDLDKLLVCGCKTFSCRDLVAVVCKIFCIVRLRGVLHCVTARYVAVTVAANGFMVVGVGIPYEDYELDWHGVGWLLRSCWLLSHCWGVITLSEALVRLEVLSVLRLFAVVEVHAVWLRERGASHRVVFPVVDAAQRGEAAMVFWRGGLRDNFVLLAAGS